MSEPAISKVMLIWDVIAAKTALWIKVWSWLIGPQTVLAPVIWAFTGDGVWRMWSVASQRHLRRIISSTDDGFKSESRNTMFHKRVPSKDQRGVCSFRFAFNSLFLSRALSASLSLALPRSLSLSLFLFRNGATVGFSCCMIYSLLCFLPFSLNVW